MTEHPDIVAMSARYERISETPTAQAADCLTVLAGLFVALSPWIIGFSESTLAVNNLIIGLAVAILGAGFATSYERTHRLMWVCPLLGIWTIIAVWTVSGAAATTGMVLGNVFGGAVIVLLGLGAMAPMYMARRSAQVR
jgi:hypothetical protein